MAKFLNGALILWWLLPSPLPGFAADGASVVSAGVVSPGLVSDGELTSSLIKSLLVLAALYALSRLTLRRRRNLSATPGRLRVLESVFIERGQRIALVQIDSRELLIACTAAEVRLLTCLSDAGTAASPLQSTIEGTTKCAPYPQLSCKTTFVSTFAEAPNGN